MITTLSFGCWKLRVFGLSYPITTCNLLNPTILTLGDLSIPIIIICLIKYESITTSRFHSCYTYYSAMFCASTIFHWYLYRSSTLGSTHQLRILWPIFSIKLSSAEICLITIVATNLLAASWLLFPNFNRRLSTSLFCSRAADLSWNSPTNRIEFRLCRDDNLSWL